MCQANIYHIISRIYECFVLAAVYLFRNVQSGTSDSLACLVGKVAIVTGGSSGIGFETSRLLASRGCKVIIACRRDASKPRDKIIETTGNPNISFKKLDLASFKSVRDFADDIRRSETKIDILVNNAGVGSLSEMLTEDGLNPVMQINYFGAFLLTHLLIDLLKASSAARIIFVTSGMAIFHTDFNLNNEEIKNTLNLPENEQDISKSQQLYCNSKFCAAYAAQEFAKKLDKYGIMCNAADTGMANTEIYKKSFAEHKHFLMYDFMKIAQYMGRDPLNAAQSSFHLASSEKLKKESGYTYFRCKRFPKCKLLSNEEFCDKLWRISEELVQLKPEEKL